MPPACTVCNHDAREAVDRELVSGRSMRSIAQRHPPLSEWAVSRHRDAHLSAALVATVRNSEGRRARSLLSRVEGIVGEAEGILTGAKETGKVSGLLATHRVKVSLRHLDRFTPSLRRVSGTTCRQDREHRRRETDGGGPAESHTTERTSRAAT